MFYLFMLFLFIPYDWNIKKNDGYILLEKSITSIIYLSRAEK